MGVPPSCHVALRGDQHVLAQRRKVLGAERTAVGGGLAVLRRTDRPPPNARVVSLHSGILPQERAQRQQPRACSPTVTAAETMRVTASVARVVIAAEAARGTVAEAPCCEAVECVRASRGSLGTARPGGRSRSCRLVRRDVGAARHRVALRGEHHRRRLGADLVQPRAGCRRCAGGAPGAGPLTAPLRGGARGVRGGVARVRVRVVLLRVARRPLRPGGRCGACRRNGARPVGWGRGVGAAGRPRVGARGHSRGGTGAGDRRHPDAARRLGGHLPCPGAGGTAPVACPVALAGAATGGRRHGWAALTPVRTWRSCSARRRSAPPCSCS